MSRDVKTHFTLLSIRKAAPKGRLTAAKSPVYLTMCRVSLKIIPNCPIMSDRYAMVIDP